MKTSAVRVLFAQRISTRPDSLPSRCQKYRRDETNTFSEPLILSIARTKECRRRQFTVVIVMCTRVGNNEEEEERRSIVRVFSQLLFETISPFVSMQPSDLLAYVQSSITTVKFLRRTCAIFEGILSDEYEHLEKIASNLEKYLMHYGTISDVVFLSLSRFSMEISRRLETLNHLLHEMECSTVRCTIWLKNHSMKLLRSRSRRCRKYSIESAHDSRPCSKALAVFQANLSPVDSLDGDFMKLCIDSIRLFSSIITPGGDCRRRAIEIDQAVNEWEDNRSFQIARSSNENLVCRTVKSPVDPAASDVDIRVIDSPTDDPAPAERETYAYKSTVIWPLIVDHKSEEISVDSSKNEDEHPALPVSDTTCSA